MSGRISRGLGGPNHQTQRHDSAKGRQNAQEGGKVGPGPRLTAGTTKEAGAKKRFVHGLNSAPWLVERRTRRLER